MSAISKKLEDGGCSIIMGMRLRGYVRVFLQCLTFFGQLCESYTKTYFWTRTKQTTSTAYVFVCGCCTFILLNSPMKTDNQCFTPLCLMCFCCFVLSEHPAWWWQQSTWALPILVDIPFSAARKRLCTPCGRISCPTQTTQVSHS